MNLFVNAVSKKGTLILFDDNFNIQKQIYFEIIGNESSLLIEKIDNFLKDNNQLYSNLENLVVINGPGSFTGVRIVTLVINTISFIYNTNITAINYFDLFDNYPIIKPSSKKDYFLKKDSNSTIQIINHEELEKLGYQKIYGEGDIKNIKIIENINYGSIIKKIKFQQNKRIKPLYIKKPNIC